MANFLDRGPWRRSVRDATAFAREAVTPVGHKLAASAEALGGRALLLLARIFDAGYRPDDLRASSVRDEVGIGVENLAVSYGDRVALADVSGHFAPASLTAVVGPNGGGKSSLLKAIAGLVALRSGRIRRAGARLAYLPQQAKLDRDFPLTVGELVALGRWRDFGSFRRPPERLRRLVVEATAAVGLEGLAERPVSDLSAGEFQRALFARLMLQDAAIILLDEPFAAIDEGTTEDLLRLVRAWHDEGRTIIAVLHDFDQVREHFPTTLMLAHTCIGWGDTASVLTSENSARARRSLHRSTVSGPGPA